jgi:lipid II isoglutaminyl synthase (glutamine-hydrolysing)
MSIYGDYGNILTLRYYLEKIGIKVIYQEVNIGQPLPERTDLYFFGGGQDNEQMKIYPDLLTKKIQIESDLLDNGVGMLAICGGFQALGQEFVTGDNKIIKGLGILPITTKALDKKVSSRSIGNIITEFTKDTNIKLVGFENHSGQTFFLENNQNIEPLGKVIKGNGNNVTEKIEGLIYGNIIGTYMHGSFLPKNPEITKYLIKGTLKGITVEQKNALEKIDLQIANAAKQKFIEANS